ncbi:hypothetical protein R6Q59_006188 [Mikania micrantha]
MNPINRSRTMTDSDGFESRKRQSQRTQPNSRQQPDPLTCPRCESANTKFCYYNNYNKTQPRYFCKACKRHWTKGGILRNVPVGGGRKHKRLVRPATVAPATTDQETYEHESKSSFFTPTSGDQKENDESYTDIEELKGLVSWDFYETFVGGTISQFSSSFDANHGSYDSSSFIKMIEHDEDSSATATATSMIMSNSHQTSNLRWKDLDTMVHEDLNKPWEDPSFKT